jgi:hypothetical protein
LAVCFSPAVFAQTSSLSPAVTAQNLDPDTSGTFSEKGFKPSLPSTILAALDPARKGRAWSAGGPPNWQMRPFHFRLAFQKPVAIGTMLATVNRQYHKEPKFRFLKPGTAYPGDPSKDSDWETIPAKLWTGYYTYTFPAGFKTRAMLYSEKRYLGPSNVNQWHLFKRRLFNMTPFCMGQGQQSSGAWWPMDVPQGRSWHGAGTIGEEQSIRRSPVTKLDPSWFILSREEGLRPVAMRFRANITDYRLYALTRDHPNPALAPDSDWDRLDTTMILETPFIKGRTHANVRLFTIDEEVETKALKMMLRETHVPLGKVAAIEEWTVWEDLKDAPVPQPMKKSPPPPMELEFDMDIDGEVACVVDNLDGTRRRNIIAQVEKTAGKHTVTWDLKGEDFRYVDVGKYIFRGIYAPLLELHYEHTYYPNVENHSPEGRPWDGRPQDGWLGNHANFTGICAVGNRLYCGSGGTEGGHATLESTLSGQKVRGWGFGVSHMFSDDKSLFMWQGSSIGRIEPETGKVDRKRLSFDGSRGSLTGMTAKDGKIYLNFHGITPYFNRSIGYGDVDTSACLPKLPTKSNPPTREHILPANPRDDFLRLFRVHGKPAGLPYPGNIYRIPSTDWHSPRQYTVLAFKKPVPIGSVVFPRQRTEDYTMAISTLKPGATLPPNPRKQEDWIPFEDEGDQNDWEVLAAPPNTMTQALRLSFTKEGIDDLADVFEEATDDPDALNANLEGDGEDVDLFSGKGWKGELDGMQILRRRFKNHFASATIRVSSGEADPKTGEWHAKRTEFITEEMPAVYALEWKEPQPLIGLCLKEIDGMFTKVDIYTGPDDKPIDIHEPLGNNWQQMVRYRQEVRSGGINSLSSNPFARYLEGFVNFGRVRETRAVRLRITRQWTFRVGRRTDQGGGSVNHRRAGVYGVAPLEYIGGEPDTNQKLIQRLATYDWETKKLDREIPSPIHSWIEFNPVDGHLYGIVDQGVAKIDFSGDEARPEFFVNSGVKSPHRIDFDSKGNLYLYDHAADRRQVYVYDRSGKMTHTIGKRGFPKPGKWDSSYIVDAFAMTVGGDNIYFNYGYDNPRRTIHFKTDGTFVNDFLGNTYYGGGGTLDRYDSTKAFYMDMVFHIDREKNRSQIVGMREFDLSATSMWGRPHRIDMVAIKANGNKYLVNIPLSHQNKMPTGFVYQYDDVNYRHRLVAAVGSCGGGYFFANPEFIELLGGKTPTSFKYIFADRNGDGKMQTNEVEITPIRAGQGCSLGRFDKQMGIMGGTLRYEVKEFLKDGTPIYHEVPVKAPGGFYRFNNGNMFKYAGDSLHFKGYNLMSDPAGKPVWTYFALSFDVSGLFIPGWSPGLVANEFAIIGHEVEERGDLGEFFVIHSNTGMWNLWTVDGLLAGRVTRHTGDPKRRGFGAEYKPGTRMDGLTASQEHFHGFFCKTEDDGKYRIVIGGDHASIIEVRGLDKFKRFKKEIEITPAVIEKTQKWEAANMRQNIFSRSPTLECYFATPIINGAIQAREWPGEFKRIGRIGEFNAAYNTRHLFLCWKTLRQGPFKNGGDDYRRFFKTGGAVDIKLQTDPRAEPARTEPAKGDIRILLTVTKGPKNPHGKQTWKPRAVLYQPVAPGTPADQKWETSTFAGGTAKFDRVVELPNIRMRSTGGTSYIVEAAIPLPTLGIRPKEGLALKCDAGILATEEGYKTIERTYWVNRMAVGTTDEPTEARLHPDRWGYIRFQGIPKSKDEKLMKLDQDDTEDEGKDVEDLVDDLENELD